MKRNLSSNRIGLVLIICMILNACSQTASVTSEVPEGAKVLELNRIKDGSLPVYLLEVESLNIPKLNIDAHCKQYSGPEALMNAALINALVSSGNFVVLDPDSENAFFQPPLKEGEIGPYVVQATLTEFSRGVVVREKGIGAEINDEDNILETMGKGMMMIPSFWVTQITGLPTSWKEREARGVVGIEVSVLDKKSGQILVSFPAHGEFVVKNKEIGDGIFGYYSAELVSSPVESAVRAAMNEAAIKLKSELSKVIR